MSVGVGIVGCGMIANFHAKAIADANHAHLVGCFNRSTEKAQAFSEMHGGKVFSSLEEMIADPEIQALSICTPSGAHLDPALAGAKAGKHILIEKPLEITTERCDAIINACRDAGVQLAVTFQS